MRAGGFTLIELVIVLTLIGVLSAVAAPRFIDYQSDVVLASTRSLAGTLRSASDMVYAKALIEHKEHLSRSTVTIQGQTIDIHYGYPTGTDAGIHRAVSIDAEDWNTRASVSTNAIIYWHGTFTGDAWGTQCFIRFKESASKGAAPVIDLITGGC
ncbi:MAG: type II secretion system protein [Pseudomonadota bacterium]|nr:type II secretion system protein [Pseudomonadota bacterium]